MKKLQKIQMCRVQLTAFTYDRWITYKVDVIYFIYTVKQ